MSDALIPGYRGAHPELGSLSVRVNTSGFIGEGTEACGQGQHPSIAKDIPETSQRQLTLRPPLAFCLNYFLAKTPLCIQDSQVYLE